MNEHLPYEVIIAQKLQDLPSPDMADAIWTRIEKQLDIDMPTDDGGNAPSSPTSGGWIGGAAFGLFVAALITIFLLYRNEKSTTPQVQPQSIPATQSPVENSNDTVRAAEPNNIILRPPASDAEPPPPGVAAPQATLPDSNAANEVTNLPDSVRSAPVISPPQQQPVQDSVKPRRGVAGISDSNYRIVPR